MKTIKKSVSIIMLSTLLITCTACGKAKEEPDIPVGSSSEAMKETAAKAYEENLGMDKEEAEEFAEQVWGEEDSNVDTSAQDSEGESNLNPQLYTVLDNMDLVDRRIYDLRYDDLEKAVDLYGKPDRVDKGTSYVNLYYDSFYDGGTIRIRLGEFEGKNCVGFFDKAIDKVLEKVRQESTITWNDNLASLFDEKGSFNKNYDYSTADIDYATFVADYCGGIEATVATIDGNYITGLWHIKDCPYEEPEYLLLHIPLSKKEKNIFHTSIKLYQPGSWNFSGDDTFGTETFHHGFY